jgi:hypothetical protein
MTADNATGSGPLWLSIEGKIEELGTRDLSGSSLETAIQTIAGELDEAGHNVSHHGGNMLHLRKAMDARTSVGHALMDDFRAALAALTLDDVANVSAATGSVINRVGRNWPAILEADRRPDVRKFVEQARVDLLVARAGEMDEQKGIRYLLDEKLGGAVILERLGVSQQELDAVVARVKAEAAERKRAADLLGEAGDAGDEEKVKLLIGKDVEDGLILELVGIGEAVLAAARQAMEEEMKEKQRLAEEAAAKKAAEAAGPALDDIPNNKMLEYIESIREILEFSDVEKEIRTMCEQSSIPRSLVDIAVSDPDKLDELETRAGG